MFTKKKIFIALIIVFALMIILTVIHYLQVDKPTKLPSALVETTRVKTLPTARTLTVYGTINVTPEDIQQIIIQNEAIVQKIYVTVGQHVIVGGASFKLCK
jgi:multidrug efflux pump subunit AcrA (membrane-fusion protein)